MTGSSGHLGEALVRELTSHGEVVTAHQLAVRKAVEIGFGRYIISATTPFSRDDTALLATDAPALLRRPYPDYDEVHAERGWSMLPTIDRVYVNARARRELGWEPRYDFRYALDRLRSGQDPRSQLALAIGAKGYHARYLHFSLTGSTSALGPDKPLSQPF